MNKIVGNRINEKRKELNLSQDELSKQLIENGLSLSREAINDIEQGERILNVVEMNVIMKVLGLSIDSFSSEEEEVNLVALLTTKETLNEEIECFLENLQMTISALIAQEAIHASVKTES